MNQLLYIDLQKKLIRVVGDRRFLAEYSYDDLEDVGFEMLETIRTTDYSKPFEPEKI
jgi:hypothetical protein